jgi:hypothetical protein
VVSGVSDGTLWLSLSEGGLREGGLSKGGLVRVPDIIAPNPPKPTIELPLFTSELVAGDGIAGVDDSPFFVTFILPQSCHELQTLHTLPSAPKIRPGGRFGCVSFVVR